MKYCAVPVIQARPVISGMIAGVPSTVVSAAMRPVNREPMNDSLISSSPTPS